jgi:hypothetical protein
MSDVTALAVRRPTPLVSGYNPPPSEDEFRGMIFMAKQLAEVQGFVPAHFYRQPNKILAAMLYGRDLGITPTNALQHIIVIEGKATADAQLMGMLVRRGGHRLEDKTSAEASTVTITRGDDGTTHTFTFTMADARRAGLVRQGSAWEKYPQAMLFARALTGCARKGAQDALMGVAYTPEELGVEIGEDGFVPTVEAVQQNTGVQAALPPTTSPASSVEVSPESGGAGAGEQPSPPPQTVPTSLGGPAFSRRMGAGRSVGPAPRRTNVVTVEQAPEKPATAPEAPNQTMPSADPVSSQPAPPALTDEPISVPPVDDGRRVYVESLRQDLRTQAATLARLNAITKNHLVHPLKGETLEEVPPPTPNAVSDAGLQQLIDRDLPGRTLETLGEAELVSRLELIEPFISKRRAVLKEKGILEE